MSHVGRYVLDAPIGEGGLGRVYKAWDPLLSRTVAVKTLQFGLDMPSRIALDRLLLNEARAAASLNHRHIVTVYDAGLSAHGVYLAMERLEGRDLRYRLDHGWRPSVAESVLLARRVADALAYAHSRGVIHCDIKPANIFLTRGGRPKVLDFGIARVANTTGVSDLEGLTFGSPHYLAPEQLSGGLVDARTDLYSLAAVLYELLSGRKAYRADSLEGLHAAVRAGRRTPLSQLCPRLPQALVRLVDRALSLDPAQRPASALDMARDLRAVAAQLTRGFALLRSWGPGSSSAASSLASGWFWQGSLSSGLMGLLSASWLNLGSGSGSAHGESSDTGHARLGSSRSGTRSTLSPGGVDTTAAPAH